MYCGLISVSVLSSKVSGYFSRQCSIRSHHSFMRDSSVLEGAVLLGEAREDLLGVADDRDVRRDVLADLGRVDVDVDELGVRGELAELARDAVVEARADREDQVGFVHRVVGRAGAVHAEHSEPLRVRRRERAEAVQRAGDRELLDPREVAQLFGCVGVDDAAADVEDRALGVGQGLGGEADLLGVSAVGRLVAGQR